MDSAQQAEELALDFLKALEDRDLSLAASMLAPDARIVFPGPAHFNSLDDIVAWSRDRYQRIGKTFERVDATPLPGGDVVVYAMGTLQGLNLHDVEFSGVRYIDRFVVREGLIVSQEVWNDLAESGVLKQTSA